MRVVLLLFCLTGAPGEESRGAFFHQPVDFWGTGGKATKAAPKIPEESEPIWEGNVPPPRPVRALLEEPTLDNARAYLEWQRQRLHRLSKAIQALEAAEAMEGTSAAPAGGEEAKNAATPSGSGEIFLFTRENCPYCEVQERLLEGLPLRRIRPGEAPELWRRHRVDATPTLVIAGRVFRGVTPRETVEAALGGISR